AFRLVENFGLLNRRDVADEIKSLDQEARGALRRLGVRFGAFHVFVPTLLKPAPAGLLTLLWALQNDGKDKPGFGDVVNGLASGRTSLVVDTAFEPDFYRLAGYRSLGRRAVRVDILERLADLIRPALSWRAGTGPRPEAAFGGAAFIVTPALMASLGATAEDIEEILKGLGYRAEAKPAVEVQARLEALDAAERERAEAKAAEAAAAQAAAAEVAAAENPGTPAGAPAKEAQVSDVSAQDEAPAAAVAEAEPVEAAVVEPTVESAAQTDASIVEVRAEVPSTTETKLAEAEPSASAAQPAADEPAEEPK